MALAKTETKSITNDFVIIVYPWETPYLDKGMNEGEPYLLDLGPHYVSFTRNKDIGGSLQIESSGTQSDANIGDWLVFKTFSKKRINRTEEKFLNEGRTKFIGQIYSKNSSHFADAEGNLRTSTQYTVREWSHVFHMQVKIDQTALAINSGGISSRGNQEKFETAFGEGSSASKKFLEFIDAKYSPFDITIQSLNFIGALSSNDERSKVDEVKNLFKVTHRLPIIPEKLFKENIKQWQDPSGKQDTFDKKDPWSTGFFWNFIGVQKWKAGKKSYKETFATPESLWNNLDLVTNTRPVALTSPLEYSIGLSFRDALKNQFGDSGMYEFYTDIVYFEESSKCAPALFVRDTPISFRKLQESAPRDSEQIDNKFGWTFFDDIPRTNVSAASILSITFNTKANDSANYMRYNFAGGAMQAQANKALATKYGVFVNIPSQRKFGTVADEWDIKAYISQENLRGNSSGKGESDASLSGSDLTNWFKALSTKAGNYYPYRFLFPSMNLYLKDDDYPITVGLAVRIQLPNTTLVGFVDSVNNIYKLQEDGKKVNEIYVKLTDTCMEDGDGNLMPMPRKLISDLLRHKVTQAEKDEILKTWKFRTKEAAIQEADS